ncbi:transaldolase (plasmid) [Alicyclobacillus fastidiosus]|uniref:Transaldolase n=1 Tax=Alicyclobacillus fastidiosus TaxID=392011 RepID=A0ABY6ZPD2_9BACL|nr:transaldolase [Alicyclobacillus fastidiosus]WAH44843.1 transaldolase [Alicyclobacillus fastidiosus]GMA65811.1 transaldolase [Alicyclobacillus fastidiosus]GMA65883.1 transaldolase [Alicyclobacillus fastidiosus]
MNGIKALQSLGQSIWYDNMDRELLISGAMAELVQQGVTGITSNPTIFEKAIKSSTAYDTAVREADATTVEQLFDEISRSDIQEACRLLMPVYQETRGKDGYVSIEVAPVLAHDAVGTVQEGRRLFEAIGMPNVMIKVPGTPEGIKAVQALTEAGINVNVTLIFSLTLYKRVMEAYIRGLHKRLNSGLDVQSVASVASFFVSRVDAAVDAQLKEMNASESLFGTAAIANAKMAYALFEETFSSSDFKELAAAGANVQRILWASTGQKNAAYDPLMYVNELVGPNSVNTVPPATLDLLQKRNDYKVTVEQNVELARQQIQSLAEVGIDIEDVVNSLLTQGLQAFNQSYASLLDALRSKQEQVR